MSGFIDWIIVFMVGGFVVFCQVYLGELLCYFEMMVQMVVVVEVGGVVVVCVQGFFDVFVVKGCVSVLVVGIWKEGDEGIYIILILCYVCCVLVVGVDVVVFDGI